MRHQADTTNRLDRSNQHRVRFTFLAGDQIDRPVHPVKQIDVRMTGWPEHRGSTLGQAARAMRRQIERTAIGLDLDDTSSRFTFRAAMDKNRPDTLAGNMKHRSGVEVTPERHDPTRVALSGLAASGKATWPPGCLLAKQPLGRRRQLGAEIRMSNRD